MLSSLLSVIESAFFIGSDYVSNFGWHESPLLGWRCLNPLAVGFSSLSLSRHWRHGGVRVEEVLFIMNAERWISPYEFITLPRSSCLLRHLKLQLSFMPLDHLVSRLSKQQLRAFLVNELVASKPSGLSRVDWWDVPAGLPLFEISSKYVLNLNVDIHFN